MATEIVDKATAEDFAAVTFDAAFDNDKMRELEAHAKETGVTRRLMLATLTRSKADLVSNGPDAVESYVSLAEDFAGYVEHLQVVIELTEAARLRLLSACTTIQATADDN